MSGSEIKELAKASGVCLYGLADRLGVCLTTLHSKLKKPLTEAQVDALCRVIQELQAEHYRDGKIF